MFSAILWKAFSIGPEFAKGERRTGQLSPASTTGPNALVDQGCSDPAHLGVRLMIRNWFKRSAIDHLSSENRSELEQAAIRVAIVGIVLVYLSLASSRDGIIDLGERQVLWVAVGTFVFSLLLMARIVTANQSSVLRRFVGMLADNGVTTYCLIQMDETGAVIIGVYLFVTFGNGFRYGRFYLHASQVMALAGFGLVVVVSEYWRSHVSLSSGVLIAIIVLPFYVGVLTKRITEAKRRADEANQAKGRFLANVSHEMRTPLNGVIAMADVLRETTLTDNQREIVETMTTSAQLLLAQIEDVLDMARIEAGRIRIQNRPFNLNAIISSTVKVVSPQAHYKGLDLSVEASTDSLDWFIGDSHHLRQVLLNLLSNAVKFTERGKVIVVARKCCDVEGRSRIRIEVRDTGIGIPECKLTEIFEPFAQADDSITRVYGGTGLGTTIAKNLVTQMGGTIGVESQQGSGSTFWFELPFAPCECPHVEETSELTANVLSRELTQNAVHARAGKVKGARVLVAEDNRTNQRVAQLILESGGHFVLTVNNGEEALEALENETFDLALFDLSMPVVSGLEALKLYLFSTPDPIPVLVASANVTAEAMNECVRAGASEFIPKPIRASILLDAIDRHLTKPSAALEMPPSPTRIERSILSVIGPPLLDSEILSDLAKLSSDPTFVDRLILGFCSDAERLKSEILDGLSTQSYERAKDAAHALKGGSASIGAVQLMRVAARIEKAGHEQLASKSPALRAELMKVCASTLGGLASHIENRKPQRRIAPAS
jgi:two-component system sensor histidine kinase RpfC